MDLRLLGTAYKGFVYHRNRYIYIALVAMLIAAIITASLLAGHSVRQTLLENSYKRLNGSSLAISSGLRYMDAVLAEEINESLGVATAPVLKITGNARNFSTGQAIHNAQLLGIDASFLLMGEADTANLPQRGEVVINNRIASVLDLSQGDQMIIRFREPSDIPSNTPFAPGEEDNGSLFLTVKLVSEEAFADFNIGISQVIPYNLFVNIEEFKEFFEKQVKCNLIIVKGEEGVDAKTFEERIAELTISSGLGLRIRRTKATGVVELITDRIFIDTFIKEEITGKIEGAEPVITYLANSIASDSGETPYSFISAISGIEGDWLTEPGSIIINQWLASDLNARTGDSITVKYFVTGIGNELEEVSARFRVTAVVNRQGIWGDSLLMPSFPGISGTRSCTQWDAGIPLDMERIREKDEEYWNDFAGTPKAFISYTDGAQLWGNQFGPATAIRFPGIGTEELLNRLKEETAIGGFGLVVSSPRDDGAKAATSGVDFSTLFLSLSFFIIVASLVLFVMLLDTHIASREGEIRTLTALGFGNGKVRKVLLLEATLPILLGIAAGVFLGLLVNRLIIGALNGVWIGAVQTDTIRAYSGTGQLITGFVATAAIAMLTYYLKINGYLKRFGASVIGFKEPAGKVSTTLFLTASAIVAIPFILLMITDIDRIMLFFSAGTILLLYLLLVVRVDLTNRAETKKLNPSWAWYSFKPSRFIAPLLFIASGLFIVISTGSNRKNFSGEHLVRSSGTGGFTHWIETTETVTSTNDIDINSGDASLLNGSFQEFLRIDGDDASCLNLNYITAPHLLGVDAAQMSLRGSFSFASGKPMEGVGNMWDMLTLPAGENSTYGFLDQTVMQWGMKLKPGDTVVVNTESGRALNIIIAGGLKTSVFQGYLLIDRSVVNRYWPSIDGANVFLAEVSGAEPDSITPLLKDAFEDYGAFVESTTTRLDSFNRVTNTYLSVFLVLGGLGMILGVLGLGLNLAGNIRSRKREFALLSATGFTMRKIRRSLFTEHFTILLAGIICGTVPALIATLPSLQAGEGGSVIMIIILIALIFVSGITATLLALRSVTREKIVTALRRD